MIGAGEDDLETAAENEGEDLEEETRDLDGLRAEILQRWLSTVVDDGKEGGSYEEFTEHCSEAGKAETEEPGAEGEDGEGWVVVERYETEGVIGVLLNGTLLAGGVEVDGTDILGDLESGELVW